MSKAKTTSVLNEISERTEKAPEKEAPSPLNRSSGQLLAKIKGIDGNYANEFIW